MIILFVFVLYIIPFNSLFSFTLIKILFLSIIFKSIISSLYLRSKLISFFKLAFDLLSFEYEPYIIAINDIMIRTPRKITINFKSF